MYIEDKYWNNYIGDTDDSLTLAAYLADKNKEEISVGEIFSDIGLDKLNGDFRKHDDPLTAVCSNVDSDYEEPYVEFYYAIDLVTDLAALLLECAVNGSVSLGELLDNGNENAIRITFTDEEKAAMNKALADFVQDPLAYDLHEMVPDEDMQQMARDCENLRKELCE